MRPYSFFRGAAAALILSATLSAAPVVALASEQTTGTAPTTTQETVAASSETKLDAYTNSDTAEVKATVSDANATTTTSDDVSGSTASSSASGTASTSDSSSTDNSTNSSTNVSESANASSSTPTASKSLTDESTASATTASTTTAATTEAASSVTSSATSANEGTDTEKTSTDEDTLAGNTFVIQNDNNGTRGVVDVAGGSRADGANVQLYESNGTAAQQWKFVLNSDGSYTIKNVNSGKVLDVYGASFTDGTNVWQYQSNGTSAQRWSVKWVDREKGLAYLLLAAHPELALDAYGASTKNGTNLQIWHANGSAAQLWYLRDLAQAAQTAEKLAKNLDVVDTLDNTDFTIASNADGRNLTVANGSKSSGAGLGFETGSDAKNAFRITREGNYWRIQNMQSGLSVAANANDIVPGAGIRQKTNSSDDSQLWVIYRSGNGYGFINKQTGLVFSNVSGLFSGVAYSTAGTSNELFKLSAWTPSVADGVYRIASGVGNSQSLDVAGASSSNNANVQDYAWNGTTAQKWYVSKKSGGYAITNLGSGLRLATNGINVVQAGNSSLWLLKYIMGSGLCLIDSQTGRVLDVAGASSSSCTNVQTWAENDTPAQIWSFIAVNAIDDGWYTVHSTLNTQKVLDVSGGSYNNGANIQLWSSNDSDAQRWYIFSLGNGYYTFINGASNKVLTANGNTATAGTNVNQQTGVGASSQRWRLAITDGQFTFVNESGEVLDVAGASTANGANVQIWNSNGTAAQRWLLRSSSASNTMRRLISFENHMLAMASDDSHGYDQAYRWGERGDYDCSSLVITCLRAAGFRTGSASYTGDLRANLQARGWQWITGINANEIQPGDIMLSEVHHVAATISHTQMVEARGNEYGEATGGRPGDQTGQEICVSPWRAQRGLHTSQSWDGILRFTGYC